MRFVIRLWWLLGCTIGIPFYLSGYFVGATAGHLVAGATAGWKANR